jgi:hypothetical protein
MSYFIASLFILLVVWTLHRAVKLRRRWQRKYALAMAEFYDHANELLRDEKLPDEILDFVEFVHAKARNPLAAAGLVWRLFSRDGRAIADGSSDHPRLKRMYEYVKANPNSGRALGQLCASAMLAMSYRAYILGGTVRHLVFFDADQHERRTCDVTAGIYEVEHARAA